MDRAPEISREEAFAAMTLFLNEYYGRAGNDMMTLLSDIEMDRGETSDPAAWDDWSRCVETVKQARDGPA